MNLSLCPDRPLAKGVVSDDLREQSPEHGPEVEAGVEAIGEGAEVLASVLAEAKRLVAAADHRLDVAQRRVDPGELRQLAPLARPTAMYECAQLASLTPAKHSRPSLSTSLSGVRLARAQFAIEPPGILRRLGALSQPGMTDSLH
jgi:hypothetical protein